MDNRSSQRRSPAGCVGDRFFRGAAPKTERADRQQVEPIANRTQIEPIANRHHLLAIGSLYLGQPAMYQSAGDRLNLLAIGSISDPVGDRVNLLAIGSSSDPVGDRVNHLLAIGTWSGYGAFQRRANSDNIQDRLKSPTRIGPIANTQPAGDRVNLLAIGSTCWRSAQALILLAIGSKLLAIGADRQHGVGIGCEGVRV